MAKNHKYNIAIIGDNNVGKTTMVHRWRTGHFINKYKPTLGAEKHDLTFHTSSGHVIFSTRDTAAVKNLSGMQNGYFANANAAIIVCDVQNLQSINNLPEWVHTFRQMCPTQPIVIVCNKADIAKNFTMNHGAIRALVESLQKTYSGIIGHVIYSSKSNFNFEKPWKLLLQSLLNTDIKLLDRPIINI